MSEDDENWKALVSEIEEDIDKLPDATSAHHVIDLRIKMLHLIAMRNISITLEHVSDDIETIADFCVENFARVK